MNQFEAQLLKEALVLIDDAVSILSGITESDHGKDFYKIAHGILLLGEAYASGKV